MTVTMTVTVTKNKVQCPSFSLILKKYGSVFQIEVLSENIIIWVKTLSFWTNKVDIMAIRVVEFSNGVYKIRKILEEF